MPIFPYLMHESPKVSDHNAIPHMPYSRANMHANNAMNREVFVLTSLIMIVG